jgi:hypothetical protein
MRAAGHASGALYDCTMHYTDSTDTTITIKRCGIDSMRCKQTTTIVHIISFMQEYTAMHRLPN